MTAPSTDATPTPALDLDQAYRLHPQVEIRPEPFGALLYHFGTRRLSFLKDVRLLDVVRALDGAPSARQALALAGISDADFPTYGRALSTLLATHMLRPAAGSST